MRGTLLLWEFQYIVESWIFHLYLPAQLLHCSLSTPTCRLLHVHLWLLHEYLISYIWYYTGAKSAIFPWSVELNDFSSEKITFAQYSITQSRCYSANYNLKALWRAVNFFCMLVYIYAVLPREGVFCLYK